MNIFFKNAKSLKMFKKSTDIRQNKNPLSLFFTHAVDCKWRIFFRYLKGKELRPGDRVGMRSSVEPDGQLVSLELTDLKLDDAGQVKVVAVNSEGDASTAARLTVNGKLFISLLA